MLKIASIVIRVNDLPAQSRFWQAALDYVEREPADEDWVVLKPRDADTPCISLDVRHSERILPPRIHLDIYADDQTAEVRRLAELGAREVQWDGRPDDADYVIMEDPEGNRFCVVESPHWSGWEHVQQDQPHRERIPAPSETTVPEVEIDENIAPRPEEEVADLLRAEPDVEDHSQHRE